MVMLMAFVVIVMLAMSASGIAQESGTRMGTRNGKPGPMRMQGDGRARGEVVRERGLLIDVVG